MYQTTFALFCQHRFGWDAMHVGYVLTLFGLLGVVIQVGVVGPMTHRIGDKWTLVAGLGCASIGLAAGAMAMRVPTFLVALVPAALGIGLCNPTLISLVSKSVPPEEQGLVQGSAGALESLGRAIGPIWGNVLLEHLGEGAAYGAAALVMAMTMALAVRMRPPVHAPEHVWK